jgi:hypothetical protein
MTTEKFFEWLKEQGCKVRPVPGDSKRNLVKITSPDHPGNYLYYNASMHDRPVKCYSICNICDQLNLPFPDNCHDHAKLAEMIKSRYY